MVNTKPPINSRLDARYTYRLRRTHGVFVADNPTLAGVLGDPSPQAPEAAQKQTQPKRVLAFVDQGVLNHWPHLPQQIRDYTHAHPRLMTLAGPMVPVPGGEVCKNDPTVFDSICQAIHDVKLSRHCFVLAIGGGAVLDVVGFAAAITHRGVRLVRLPTTTLAQADAGIGVKNGINAFNKKNYFGTFTPPWAVVNDESFLNTLCDRDWRCGFSETVKVALVKAPLLFGQIVAVAPRIAKRDHEACLPILRRCAELHLSHILESGDPFEQHNARPLDFGHWSAHKLEQLSGFRLRHGEAVAIGIALDTIYSEKAGLLPGARAKQILACLNALGFTLHDGALQNGDALLEGLEEFREHLGGDLRIPLLTAIGHAVDAHEIDHRLMQAAIEQLQAEPVCS